jgi:hypothetical protein
MLPTRARQYSITQLLNYPITQFTFEVSVWR